jgi:peptidoglycan/xylan/chitin deacetylase (PgdA/CDA1 family)
MTKRDLYAKTLGRIGVVSLLESLPQPDSLVVFNYHRVGDRRGNIFDAGVFSATAEEFDDQIEVLRRRYHIATLDEAVEMVSGHMPVKGVNVLITFDDGYLDNYQNAYKILKSHGVQGTFFLVSSYVGSSVIPWWDRIAFYVRQSQRPLLQLSYPEPYSRPLPLGRRQTIVMDVLNLFKSVRTSDPQRFLTELREACEPIAELPNDPKLFLNWDQAREMVAGGMAIGSHTDSHQILGKLGREDQIAELTVSRSILMEKLGIKIDTLAYPVGGRTHFNEITTSVLDQLGYRAAFSFYGGVNFPGQMRRFDVQRVPVAAGTHPARFRTQMALAARADGFWF